MSESVPELCLGKSPPHHPRPGETGELGWSLGESSPSPYGDPYGPMAAPGDAFEDDH